MNISKISQNNSVHMKGSGFAQQNTVKPVRYNKSSAATEVGAVVGCGAFTFHIAKLFQKKLTKEDAEKIITETKKLYEKLGIKQKTQTAEELLKANANIRKYAFPFAIAAGALSLGCGILVDKIRNEKALQKAEIVRKTGVKNALRINKDIDISRNGGAYYNSNIGVKYGALLGAGCGMVHGLMNYIENRQKSVLTYIIVNSIIFALGGLAVGKIADNKTNKEARENI